MAGLPASTLGARWKASVAIGCALLSVVGCSDSDGFSSAYDNEQALLSSLGCTLLPDDEPIAPSEASGVCNILNAPLTVLFFDGPDDRTRYADDTMPNHGVVFEGYNFLLWATEEDQVRWVRERLAPGSFREVTLAGPATESFLHHGRVDEQQPWAISLTILATDAEAAAISERVSRVVCDDPNHDGPCVNPWSLSRIPVADLDSPEQARWADAVQELLEQRAAESRDL